MFKLFSWNVLADAYVRASYYPRSPSRLLKRGARTSAIVERIATCDADVVCLQEVEFVLLAELSDRLPNFEFSFLKKEERPDGCATLVRDRQILSTREIHYDDGSRHVALAVEIVDANAVVGIANTHIKWDPPETEWSKRFARSQLTTLTDAMSEKMRPWTMCGDFNFTPDDVAYRFIEEAALMDADRN